MLEENIRLISRRPAVYLLFAIFSIVLGFIFTYPGMITWDDAFELRRGQWILSMYGLADPIEITTADKLYGPYWAAFLALAERFVFFGYEDPTWVWHALNLALFPFGLFCLLALLIAAGVSPSTAFLATAMCFGMIRFGGHAMVNVKDFPHAMVFALVSVALYTFLRRQIMAEVKRASWRDILWFLFVATLPYFFRTPLLIHFLGSILFLILYFLLAKERLPLKWLLRLTLIPFLLFFVWVALTFPLIWLAGPRDWFKTFVNHGNLFADGQIRVMGQVFNSQALPWWYVFPFFLLGVHPAVFFLAVIGLVSGVLVRKNQETRWPMQLKFAQFNFSLRHWLLIITLPLLALFCTSPNIYDEERHFLFLFPTLFIAAALGLDFLPVKWKFRLSLLVVVLAVVSYGTWGKYSYIYQSNLLGRDLAGRFMGDYWGVCQNEFVLSTRNYRLKEDVVLYIPQAADVSRLQFRRMGQVHNALPSLRIVHEQPKQSPYYYLLINRMNEAKYRDLENRATFIWQNKTPVGEFGCALFYVG